MDPITTISFDDPRYINRPRIEFDPVRNISLEETKYIIKHGHKYQLYSKKAKGIWCVSIKVKCSLCGYIQELSKPGAWVWEFIDKRDQIEQNLCKECYTNFKPLVSAYNCNIL